MKLTEEQKQKQKEAREEKARNSVFGKRPMERSESLVQGDPIIKQIRAQVDSMKASQRTMIESVFLIGELLSKKKNQLPHGNFIFWIEENENQLGMKVRQAQKYLKVFQNKKVIESNTHSDAFLEEISLNKALSMIEEKGEQSINEIKEAYSLFRSGKKLSSKQKTELRVFLEQRKDSLQTKLTQIKEELKELGFGRENL